MKNRFVSEILVPVGIGLLFTFLWMFFSLFVGAVVHATDRYVSPTGSGSACSSGSPCSVATGAAATVAGDTLYFQAGTYTNYFAWPGSGHPGAISINSGTSESNRVIFSAAPGQSRNTVTIRPTTAMAAFDGYGVFNLNGASYVTIRGFNIDATNFGLNSPGPFFNGVPIVINPPSHHITIENNTLQRGSGGICCGSISLILRGNDIHTNGRNGFDQAIYLNLSNGGTGALLEYNTVHDNAAWGFHLYPNVSDMIVRFNQVYRNGFNSSGDVRGDGIMVHGGSNNQIYGNLVWGNNQAGIRNMAAATNTLIYNNTIYGNNAANDSNYAGIRMEGGTATARNNLIFQNFQPTVLILGASLTQSNNLCESGCAVNTSTPQFASTVSTDANFLKLTSGSPAVGQGLNLGSPYNSSPWNVDLAGVTRPQGAYDIGAYEFASAQTIFSSMDAETGNMSAWSAVIRDMNTGGNSDYPTASQTIVKNGKWSYKFEEPLPNVTTCCDWNYTMVHSYGPNISSNYLSGFYSFWLYIDAGFTGEVFQDWRTILNWFTTNPYINPILNLELHGGHPTVGGNTVQLSVLLKNAESGCYAAPNITGYVQAGNGRYFMTASSPQGIVPFPLKQWVHVEMEYVMAVSNGAFRVWQDGIKIFDLTAPTFNTAHASSGCKPGGGDMFIQFGMYNGPRPAGGYPTQRFYMDDFKYSNVQLGPGSTPPTQTIAITSPSSTGTFTNPIGTSTVALAGTATNATSISWTCPRCGTSGGAGGTLTNWTANVTGLKAGINVITVQADPGAVTATIAVTFPPTFPGNTLAGAWSFDACTPPTCADSSGNNNNGVLTNGATTTPSGKFGAALLLDGVNDYLSVPDSNSSDFTHGFTYSMWVLPEVATTAFAALISKDSTINNFVQFLYATSIYYCNAGAILGGFRANGSIGPDFTVCYPTLPLQPSQWSHVALTYNGTALTLYLNGVAVATAGATGYMEPSTGPLRIGNSSFTDEPFQGSIDEVRAYNFALPPTGPFNTALTPTCSPAQWAENNAIATVSIVGNANCPIIQGAPPLTIKIPTGLKMSGTVKFGRQ